MKFCFPSVASSRVATIAVHLAVLAAGSILPSFASDGARIVKYGREDIVPVHAKLRFSTLIVLPGDEEILDFTTGDREFWIINGAHNLCYVHPAQAGIRSNLNLITASGHVYSFLLTEISGDASAEPDLKLFVEPRDGPASNTVLRGYVRAADAEAYKKELEAVRNQAAEQVRAALARASEEISQFRFWFPPSITTTALPTSAAARAKSLRSTKSRTASRIWCLFRSKTACTSCPRSSTRVTSVSGKRN